MYKIKNFLQASTLFVMRTINNTEIFITYLQ